MMLWFVHGCVALMQGKEGCVIEDIVVCMVHVFDHLANRDILGPY
jgi:hypothetical protein